MFSNSFAWALSLCFAVPLPEVPEADEKPGVIFQDTGPEESRAEFLYQLAREFRLYGNRLAARHPSVAEFPFIQAQEKPATWIKDHLIVEVDDEVGTLRLWMDDGPDEVREAVIRVLATTHLTSQRQRREDADRTCVDAEERVATAFRRQASAEKSVRIVNGMLSKSDLALLDLVNRELQLAQKQLLADQAQLLSYSRLKLLRSTVEGVGEEDPSSEED